jgi:maltose alpha-D-glucosyltransferase/alpha-amylase
MSRYAALSTISTTDAPARPEKAWYQRAVFYEVLVRAFADGNNDGTGDLIGLLGKLDYLAWLGVDCIWLPPIYASPLRDGGYDISDYRSVHPQYGTTADLERLIAAAHERGLRVIGDLVMNHTSDQHAWFHASRVDPHGPYGDYYVWRENNTEYPDARVVFFDVEASNWSFDPVRGEYYWHRFYGHQPDLNFDNPAVVDELFSIVRFWLDKGIDGFRLDAVPFLYERDGTDCAHLPETHHFLSRLRTLVEDEYPGRVLLAEANGWPTEVAHYFGNEPDALECHMAFHFPVMPQLFAALVTGSRYPISHVLAETPKIPAQAQWGLFLRNHDELSLEMVSVADRELIYATYAPVPRMRANEGIRRRLAPLVGGDRVRLELLNALLLSLPGSPILYYGDEIGMGDNIWLPDRDAVRTPMQWDSSTNAGFSRAEASALYSPLVLDLDYHYDKVNVAAQRGDPDSLLSWTREMLATRRRHPAFGVGEFAEVSGENPALLAYVRSWEGDVVLAIANLSQDEQRCALPLAGYAGWETEIVAGSLLKPLPRIDEMSEVALDGYRWVWLRLTPHSGPA